MSIWELQLARICVFAVYVDFRYTRYVLRGNCTRNAMTEMHVSEGDWKMWWEERKDRNTRNAPRLFMWTRIALHHSVWTSCHGIPNSCALPVLNPVGRRGRRSWLDYTPAARRAVVPDQSASSASVSSGEIICSLGKRKETNSQCRHQI